MTFKKNDERVEILSQKELGLTITRLASEVIERTNDPKSLLLLGIPTRGVYLSKVLAQKLEGITGDSIAHGSLDPIFHNQHP